MTGLLGLLGWKVTVISSNFIAHAHFNYGNEYSYEHKIFAVKRKFSRKDIFEIIS